MPLYTRIDYGHTKPLSVDGYKPSLGESMAAAFRSAWNASPMQSLIDMDRMNEAERPLDPDLLDMDYNELMAHAAAMPEKDARAMSLDEQKRRIAEAGLEGMLKAREGYTGEALEILIEAKKEENRNSLVAASAPGWHMPFTFGAGLTASMLDPINAASAFVPVIGEARMIKMLGSATMAAASPGKALLARSGIRAATGAASGLVGAAAVEPLTMLGQQTLQADYGMADSLLNLGFGAVFGAAFHAGFGALGEWRRKKAGMPQAWEYVPETDESADYLRLHADNIFRAYEDLVNGMDPEELANSRLAGKSMEELRANALGTAIIYDSWARHYSYATQRPVGDFYSNYIIDYQSGELAPGNALKGRAGGDSLDHAMYRNDAQSMDEFLQKYEKLKEQGVSTYFDFQRRKIARDDNLAYNYGVWLGVDQVSHIKKRHPDFNDWDKIPEVLEKGKALKLGKNAATGEDTCLFTLSDGNAAIAVVGSPVASNKKGNRIVVLTAFRSSEAGIENWAARFKKENAVSFQGSGGSPANPSPHGDVLPGSENGIKSIDTPEENVKGNADTLYQPELAEGGKPPVDDDMARPGDISGNTPESIQSGKESRELAQRFADIPFVDGEDVSPDFSGAVENSVQRKALIGEIKSWAKEFFKSGTKFSNADTGWNDIIINARGIQNSLSHGFDNTLARSVPLVPRLIESGIFLETNPKKDGLISHVFANKLRMGGKDYVAGFVIREDNHGKRFYDHELTEIVGPDLHHPEGTLQESHELGARANQGQVIEILRNRLGVKDGTGKVLFQSSASRPNALGGNALYQDGIGVEAQERLNADVAAWEKTVDDFMAGRLDRRKTITMLNQTPLVLTFFGADPNLRVSTDYGKLSKILKDKHKLPESVIKQVPAAMADPVMVFESATVGGDYIMMLDLKTDKGATVVVPISLEYAGSDGLKANYVTSIYAKAFEESGEPKNKWFAQQIESGLLRYKNNKKSRDWTRTSRLQLPGANSRTTSGNKKVFTEADLVKLRNENPSFYQSGISTRHRKIRKGISPTLDYLDTIKNWDLSQATEKAFQIIEAATLRGEDLLEKLAQKGLPGTPAEIKPVVEILARTFVKADINEIKTRFEIFAAEAHANNGIQYNLIKTTPAEAFRRAFLEPCARVGELNVEAFNADGNDLHKAIRWAVDNGGGKQATVEKALEKLGKKLASKKIGIDEKAELKGIQSALAPLAGKIEIFEPALGKYFKAEGDLEIPRWDGEPARFGPEAEGGMAEAAEGNAAQNVDINQFRSARASVSFVDEGHAIVTFFKSADLTSAPHELYHIIRRQMELASIGPKASPGMRELWGRACDFVGAKPGEAWSVEMEEKFARAGERYLLEGIAPNARLAPVMEQMKERFMDVYADVEGAGLEISDGMRETFSRMFSIPVDQADLQFRLAVGDIVTRKWENEFYDGGAEPAGRKERKMRELANEAGSDLQAARELDGMEQADLDELMREVRELDPEFAEGLEAETAEMLAADRLDVERSRLLTENESLLQDYARCVYGG